MHRVVGNKETFLAPLLHRSLNYTPNWGKINPPDKPQTTPPTAPDAPPSMPPPESPPPPPPLGGELAPQQTLNEVQLRACLEALLGEPYLAVQRRLEMANLLIGFEQANHYTLFNRLGEVVGYMAEERGASNMLVRNVLKTHRPFAATIFDPLGNILSPNPPPPFPHPQLHYPPPPPWTFLLRLPPARPAPPPSSTLPPWPPSSPLSLPSPSPPRHPSLITVWVGGGGAVTHVC